MARRVGGPCFGIDGSVPTCVGTERDDPGFKTVDSIEARVQGCATCHGQKGQGTKSGHFPRIAGKPVGYLYNQMVAFATGTRHNDSHAQMRNMARGLSATEVDALAAYYASR